MSDDDLLDAFEKAAEAEESARRQRVEDMFVQPAICRACGAQVALPEVHEIFHSDLRKFTENVSASFKKLAGPGRSRPRRAPDA